MKTFQECVAALICVGIFALGMGVGAMVTKKGFKDDYHCQPITSHNTLEDAKAQVEHYQERVK
jgi:hypothetical protein